MLSFATSMAAALVSTFTPFVAAYRRQRAVIDPLEAHPNAAAPVLRDPANRVATRLSQGRVPIRDGDPRSVRPACQDPVDLPEQPPRDTG